MTLGEKIIHLRNSANITQEQLAKRLAVSRQSVSKWEMDTSVPQINKIVEICDIFSVSADELLREDIEINRKNTPDRQTEGSGYPGKYFGTDGFRGESNAALTSSHAYRVGRFLGWYFSSSLSGNIKFEYRPRIVIGKDTRRSSYMLEYSIVAGITASGADVYMLHVTTTPSVSFVTKQDEFDCGIMITASHNPYYDNGIKIVNRYGEKLDDRMTALIEEYLDGDLSHLNISGDDLPLAKREKIGRIVDYVAGRNRYVGYLISLASHSYKNLKIALDCANGASWMIAKAVFDALGAQTYVIGASPNGTNINDACGSTHIETLCEYVRTNHLDVGFAFDGDADRCIAVDEQGKAVNGDKILYILGLRLKSRDMLHRDTVVTTVMSNMGLQRALNNAGIQTVTTTVGDRFVYECMQENGYQLGGEQSGHIILRKYATTGDALLTAIMLTEEIKDRKTTLSNLASPVELFPQVTRNFKVNDKNAIISDVDIQNAVTSISRKLGDKGRMLLRASGTEPVIRVMAECQTEDECQNSIELITEVLKRKRYIE